MIIEKQNPNEDDFKNENYLEASLSEHPPQSLTELEKYYYESIKCNYPIKEDSL